LLIEHIAAAHKTLSEYEYTGIKPISPMREVQQKWTTGPDVASWNLSRQSSQSFSKDVLLAENLKIPIWEFFNRIGSKRTSVT